MHHPAGYQQIALYAGHHTRDKLPWAQINVVQVNGDQEPVQKPLWDQLPYNRLLGSRESLQTFFQDGDMAVNYYSAGIESSSVASPTLPRLRDVHRVHGWRPRKTGEAA
ncbi:MAG: hypothetical protein ACUVXJ_01430 [Phycisphaerae bacterium]